MPNLNPGSQFQEVWIAALTKYKKDTERDYLEGWLGEDSPDALFRLLDVDLQGRKKYQKRRTDLRAAILPILDLVIVSSKTIGESLVMASPPAKAVSIAIRLLLKAAKDVSANYDTVTGMFEHLNGLIGRLSDYNQQEITEPLKKIIVDILGQLLVVLGVATKRMKQNRIAILRKNTGVTDAMERLRTISNQEVPQTTSSNTPSPHFGLDCLVIWDRAISAYNQYTESYYLIEGGLGADSPDALFGILDNELNRFKQYRKKGEKLRSAIESVLNMVNAFSDVVREGLATFPPAKAVSVAIRVLLKTAKDVGGNYDMIIEMFEKLKGFMGRLHVYIKQNITEKFKEIIVDILAQVLVVLGVATKWIKKTRFIQYSKILFRKSTGVTDAMGKLQTFINREVPMVAAGIHDNAITIRDDGLRQMIHSWLKPPDPTTDYNTAIETRQVGTGDWFIRREGFVHWMKTAGSFLWIHGIPGNGKTIICSTVIEALQARVDSSVALAYFYFDFNDYEKLIHRNMLHSLVFQLFQQCPGPLIDLYKRTNDGSRQSTVGELLDVLKRSAGSFSETYIILDGLDECVGSERTAVLRLLADIQSWDLEPLHVLAASRPVQEIKEKIKSFHRAHHVDLHDATAYIKGDIQVYLDNTLKDDPRLNKWGSTEKALIKDTLVKRANGMFRWVHCQLDSLRDCVTAADLKTALKILPKTLDETYERILQNIPDHRQEAFHRILQFLCFSERPMLLGELAEVVTVAIDAKGQAHYDSESRMRDLSDVLKVCGSLVSLSTSPGAADNSTFDQWRPEFPSETLAARILRLAHFSVKEYLGSKRIRTGRASNYSVNAELANRSIAMTCLVYLMQFDTDELDENRMKKETDVALALYAARHWVSHFQQQGPAAHQPLQDLAQEFFHLPRRACFLNWIRMYDLDQSWDPPKWRREADTIPEPLYYSCSAGFLNISRWLLTKGANINAQGGQYGNALQASSTSSRESIVQLLLDGGAAINAQGGYLGNALQAAADGGHEKIVRLLLDQGAAINAQGGYFGNALQAASDGGHETVVRLLLDRGADLNTQGGRHGSALQAVLTPHHYRPQNSLVAKILWDAGARLYSMPSEAHSEEYIARLPKMKSMAPDGTAKAPDAHYSRRRSWS